jgi:hypothetical protein
MQDTIVTGASPSVRWNASLGAEVGDCRAPCVPQSAYARVDVGTQRHHDEGFIASLKAHGIDAVVDIRLHNEGRRYGFTPATA